MGGYGYDVAIPNFPVSPLLDSLLFFSFLSGYFRIALTLAWLLYDL